MNSCLNCSKETRNPKYCSRSCAGHVNGNLYPKRTRADWTEIQAYYDSGKTLNDIKKLFHVSSGSWSAAVKRGDIIPRTNKVKLEDVLSGKRFKSRSQLRKILIKFNLMKYECTICGNPGIWQDTELALDLDHINGINNDDRLENLRFLCPNCHRQTDTFAGKNVGKGTYNRTNKKYKTRGYDPHHS